MENIENIDFIKYDNFISRLTSLDDLIITREEFASIIFEELEREGWGDIETNTFIDPEEEYYDSLQKVFGAVLRKVQKKMFLAIEGSEYYKK